MTQLAEIERFITRALTQKGPCTLELLAKRLQTCTWNQVFMAVDVLSRRGAITLRPQARFQYLVSLATTESKTFPHQTPVTAVQGIHRIEMS